MLNKLLKFNLQLFGEGGGDGGDGGSASATGEATVGTSGENIPAHIPERAKKYYQKAMEKHSAMANAQSKTEQTEPSQPTNETQTTETAKVPYDELIKGDYKDEHKAYMDKAISERFKKYKGLEETNGKLKGILDIVASKYGVDPNDENFLDTLNQKIEADDSYYEDYAMKHDVSTEEARKIVTMERKVAQIEAQEEARRKQEQMQQHMMILRKNAEATKARFPQFDLDAEMQDEKFRRLCAVNNGDTTAAYMACHWNQILPAQVSMAAQQAQVQTAQAVAANKARPIENGISSTAPSVVEQNFKGMNLAQIRAYADEQRRRGR
jgi:uncharacterized protein YajQ (UPF0234 family)